MGIAARAPVQRSRRINMSDSRLQKASELEVASRLSKLVYYNPETGDFIWKKREGQDVGSKVFNSTWAGKRAGKVEKDGYVRISLKVSGRSHWIRAHRLAWYMVYGALPVNEVDHVNQQKGDNKIANLRDVTRTQNMRNRPMLGRNTSGVNGVCWSKSARKWQSYGQDGGKFKVLGTFHDIEKASSVANAFRMSHGYSESHGKSAQQATT